MFMSCIGILILCFVNSFADPPSTTDKPPPVLYPTEPIGPNQSPSPPVILPQPCQGGSCRVPPNLVGPIVGAICGVIGIVVIAVFLIWFCFKRKNPKSKEVSKQPEIKFIEHPPLYTGAISTTDSKSRLYGMSPTRNNSMTSHYYETVNYNERP